MAGSSGADASALARFERQQVFDADIPAEAGEGYARVALSLIAAMEIGGLLYTALNVSNHGSSVSMAYDDVVEVSCRVDTGPNASGV